MRRLGWGIGTASLALALACGGDDSGGDDGGDAGSGTAATTAVSSGGDGSGPGPTTTPSGGNGSGDTTGNATTDGGPTDDAGSTGDPGVAGSLGCGMAIGDPEQTWNYRTADVDGTMREYWLWLPPGYDPATPYPIVYQFHGCSSTDNPQDNNPPVQDESGAAAVHVRGRAVTDCWDSGPNGSDVAFFDALVDAVEAEACVDTGRRFATGYSSGAFMTHRLSCERGDMLRGVASIAGGSGGNMCVGQVAALLIHDADDMQVGIDASVAARDLNLQRNGCDTETPPTDVDPAPCVSYAGCQDGYPVVWCQTSAQGHSRQDELSAPAFWGFLQGLPASP